MAAGIDHPGSADTPTRHTRRALSAGLTRLQKQALKALGYIVLVYLLYRLLPALKQALHSLERVWWEWIVGAVALRLTVARYSAWRRTTSGLGVFSGAPTRFCGLIG